MKYQIACLAVIACVLVLTEARKAKICDSGKKIMKECNTCTCNKDGTDMVCTKRNCPPTKKPDHSNDAMCEPGTKFRIECNTCTCPPSGLMKEASCTKLPCSKPSQ